VRCTPRAPRGNRTLYAGLKSQLPPRSTWCMASPPGFEPGSTGREPIDLSPWSMGTYGARHRDCTGLQALRGPAGPRHGRACCCAGRIRTLSVFRRPGNSWLACHSPTAQKARSYRPARRTYGETATPVRVVVTSALVVNDQGAVHLAVGWGGGSRTLAFRVRAGSATIAHPSACTSRRRSFVGPGGLEPTTSSGKSRACCIDTTDPCIAWARSDLNAHLVG
jgi:hypothetical protein